jgi:PKD repeat protein
MMKKIVSSLVCAIALLAFSAAAQAATANFQGNCTTSGSNVSCTFDELRPSGSPSSCPGSYIWFSVWDFGDGNSQVTGNSTVSHTYTAPLAGSYQVDLSVVCADDNNPHVTRFVCISFGFPGCILNNNGWN